MTNNDERELHVFGEASEDAFCAIAYVVSAGIDYRAMPALPWAKQELHQ